MSCGLKWDKIASDVSLARPEGLERENVHDSVGMKLCRSAMTHQYKQMQKEYNDELEQLNKTLQEREEELSIICYN